MTTYARNFNGTTNKGTITAGSASANTLVYPSAVNSTKRHSHPVPFALANGNVLIGYTSNEGGANFAWRVSSSSDGGVTWGASVIVGGAHSGGTDTFEGSFCQLSGGTVFCVYGFGTSVRYKLSTDNGATWGSETTIVASTTAGDPHPSCVLDGSTLTVVYADNPGASGLIKAIQATVTSSTVGSFGAATNVAASDSKDPNIASPSSGVLVCSYMVVSTLAISVARSTNGGTSWGAGAAVGSGSTVDTGTNGDPNLLFDSGYGLWLTFTVGAGQSGTYPSVVPGTRNPYVMFSSDAGVTWSARAPLFTPTTPDLHRVNGCIYQGSPLFFAASIGSDTDYHIDRMVPLSKAIANVRAGQPPNSIENLQTWTAFAWFKYAGTPTASQNMYILSKDGSTGAARVFIQFRDDGTYTNGLLGFVERATTSTSYVANNAIADSTWTFVVVDYDDARGNTDRIRIYKGTTLADFAQLSTTVITEGSGAATNDTDTSLMIGGRSTDNARNFIGDIGGICGVIKGTYTLAQLKLLMGQTTPAFASSNLAASYNMQSPLDDRSVFNNDGTFSGTTASGTTPPEIATFLAGIAGPIRSPIRTSIRSAVRSQIN